MNVGDLKGRASLSEETRSGYSSARSRGKEVVRVCFSTLASALRRFWLLAAASKGVCRLMTWQPYEDLLGE